MTEDPPQAFGQEPPTGAFPEEGETPPAAAQPTAAEAAQESHRAAKRQNGAAQGTGPSAPEDPPEAASGAESPVSAPPEPAPAAAPPAPPAEPPAAPPATAEPEDQAPAQDPPPDPPPAGTTPGRTEPEPKPARQPRALAGKWAVIWRDSDEAAWNPIDSPDSEDDLPRLFAGDRRRDILKAVLNAPDIRVADEDGATLTMGEFVTKYPGQVQIVVVPAQSWQVSRPKPKIPTEDRWSVE